MGRTDWGSRTLYNCSVFFLLFLLLYLSKRIHLHQTERALSFWMSGKDMSKKMDKGKPKLAAPFSELEWGSKARGWSQAAERLTAEQWRAIIAEATICGKGLPQDEANGDDDPDVDPRAIIEL